MKLRRVECNACGVEMPNVEVGAVSSGECIPGMACPSCGKVGTMCVQLPSVRTTYRNPGYTKHHGPKVR